MLVSCNSLEIKKQSDLEKSGYNGYVKKITMIGYDRVFHLNEDEVEKIILEYNEYGFIENSYSYYREELKEYSKCKYDKNNFLIEITSYNSDNTIKSVDKNYKYDRYGNELSSESYNSLNILESTFQNEYKYNDSGNILQRIMKITHYNKGSDNTILRS